MKKNRIHLALLLLLTAGCIAAQTFVPLTTTGYSLDGVAENTTAISTTGGALDASDFVLYSQFYGTLYGGGATGLPNNGTIASGTRTYQLQPYTGFNTVRLFAGGQDSINVLNPQPYPVISLLGFGTQGAATASITLRFTDNTTQVFTPLTMDDWFGTSPAVYSGFDRALRTTGAPALVGALGNPKFFAFDLGIACANQGKAVKSIKIKNNSASSQICVMAVSGGLPSYSISSTPASLCSGATGTLSAVGLTSYTWLPVNNFTGSTSSSVVVTPNTSTTYTLIGTSSGCPAYATTTIVVSNGSPVLAFSGSTPTVCLGAAATISASGALNYTLSNALANNVPFTPTASAVYTVTGANGCGVNTQTYAVAVSPLIVSASTATPNVCSGAAVTLSASGAATYTWLPVNLQVGNAVVNPTVTTTYTLLGKIGGCNGATTLALAVKPNPTLTISPASAAICQGDSILLTGSGNAITYTWSPGGQNSTSIYARPNQLTLYTISGTNSVNCISNAQQAVFVNPNPTIYVSSINPTVCIGGPATVIATGATTYSWNQISGTATQILNPLATAVYTVMGALSTGCFGTATVLLSVYIPTLSITANTSICPGGSLVLSAGAASNYSWTNGLPPQQFVQITPLATTIYSVNALVYGPGQITCPASNSVQVTVNSNPVVTISSNRSSTVVCSGEPLRLTGSGALTYLWSTGVSTSSILVNPTTTRTYSLTGTDANGCESTVQYSVKVIICTGIGELSEHPSLKLYPNPSSGRLLIKADKASEIAIYSMSGQLVLQLSLDAKTNFEEQIQDLAEGIYSVKQSTEDGLFQQKLIIQK